MRQEDVQRFKGGLVDAGATPKTVNNVLTVLSVILRCALKWEVIDSMPHLELVKVPPPAFSFYDFSDYARLLDAGHAIGTEVELLVLLGGDAGLRRGEILGLEWSDIDWKRNSVHVQRSVWGKYVST